ncbi:MAG: hypothetical protein ACOYVK_10675 [Bacillota bacterium]
MKKLVALSTAVVLTLSVGAVALAANADSTVNSKSNVKQSVIASGQTVAVEDNVVKQSDNSNVSSNKVDTNNYTQMIEIEKLRLQQAIDNGVITQEQANYWKSQIQQMEDNYNKNGTTSIPGYNQGISSERFKQMIEMERNRLQQAIDRGMLNKTQEDFWGNQIDIMEKNYKNNNFSMNDICLSFYDNGMMWNENYNYNSNKSNQPTSSRTSLNDPGQSTYRTVTTNNTQKTDTPKTNNVVNNRAFNQRMQGPNMNYNNFNDCTNGNWNTRNRY